MYIVGISILWYHKNFTSQDLFPTEFLLNEYFKIFFGSFEIIFQIEEAEFLC